MPWSVAQAKQMANLVPSFGGSINKRNLSNKLGSALDNNNTVQNENWIKQFSNNLFGTLK